MCQGCRCARGDVYYVPGVKVCQECRCARGDIDVYDMTCARGVAIGCV